MGGVVVGSCRRRAATVGDVDVLVPLAAWASPGMMLEGRFASGVPWQAWAAAPVDYVGLLTHLTGSREHNELLRQAARVKGLAFLPWGVFDQQGAQLPLESERHLFKVLGVDWKEPNERG